MSTLIEKRDRHIVPRWRPSDHRLNNAEFSPARPSATRWEPNLSELERPQQEWEQHRTLPFASDLLGVALVLDKPQVAKSAALSVLRSGLEVPTGLLRLARRVLGEISGPEQLAAPRLVNRSEASRSKIHLLRERLRKGPINPLLWADLALMYSSVGKNEKSAKCLQIAQQLAPNNRSILRGVARFHVHQGRPDTAVELLRRSPLVKVDPWIISAEIAASELADRKPSNIRHARAILESNNFTPDHISELASAVGSLELRAGSLRRARQLFRQSLIMPTENSIAQATWMANEERGLDVPGGELFTVPNAFEAQALHHYYADNWKPALDAVLEWQNDEPFSVLPAIMGSHLAAVVFEDYGLTEQIARQGLVANPDEFIVLNNLVFALANNNQPSEAARLFRTVDPRGLSPRYQIFYLATSGLIQYRLGDHSSGRVFYQRAIDLASSERAEQERTTALLYFAREELRINSTDGPRLIHEATEAGQFLKAEPKGVMRLMVQRLLSQR